MLSLNQQSRVFYDNNYPEKRGTYSKKVGDIREKGILRIFNAIFSSDYDVELHDDSVNANGVDLAVSYDNKPIAKFEVINENVGSYIDSKRAESIRKNLRGVRYKGLICSHGNLAKEAKRILKNIPILKLGFQTLPLDYHQFYSKIKQIYKRKIDSKRALKFAKNIILSFLRKIGLVSLMYISSNNSSNKKISKVSSVQKIDFRNSGILKNTHAKPSYSTENGITKPKEPCAEREYGHQGKTNLTIQNPQFRVVENPLRSKDFETCTFCKQFYTCPKILRFCKAFKEDFKFWENELESDESFPYWMSLEQYLTYLVTTPELAEATTKVYNCLRSKLHLYFKKHWKDVFLTALYQYEFDKRCQYLQGEEIRTLHPERKEKPIRI